MTLDRRSMIGLSAAALASQAFAETAWGQTAPPTTGLPLPTTVAVDPTETIDLWPAGVPGLPAKPPVEVVQERSKSPDYADRAAMNVVNSRLVVFRPTVPANGAAILITPGGGYRWVVVDKEGYELGRWLAARGFTVFVLFYRLPGDGWAAGSNVVLQDTQRAMRIIRHRASDYGVDPARVAAMGFSAGGHACADLAARFAQSVYTPIDAADRLSARPLLAAPIYPVISMRVPNAHAGSRSNLIGANPTAALEQAHSPNEVIPADAPPHFILHAEDDDIVPVENALLLRAGLRARGVAVETHLFPRGGHGFGLRLAKGKPVENWPLLFDRWARDNGLASPS